MCPRAILSQLCSIVKGYTKQHGMIYFKVNVALALDYERILQEEAEFIRQLSFTIQVLPGYTGTAPLTRGANFSDAEIKRMERLGEFYFPSFTSASTGAGFSDTKNTVIEIDASDAERITLDIGNSPYRKHLTDYGGELEVLIMCYSRFRFLGVEPLSGGRKRLRLKLLDSVEDPLSEHREMLELYHKAKFGQWEEAFQEINGDPHKAQIMVRYSKPTSGWTMLHQAAWWGNQAAVNQLVHLGADLARRAKSGHSAEQVAIEHGKNINWAEAMQFGT